MAEDYLAAVGYQFSQESFAAYIQAFQQVTVLKMAEIWMLVPVMKLVLMEHIAELGRRLLEDPCGIVCRSAMRSADCRRLNKLLENCDRAANPV